MATMIRISLIEALDQWEAQMIADFLSSYDTLLMRATCSYIRDRTVGIATFSSTPARKKKHDANWFLSKSARKSHRDLCELARKWWCETGSWTPLDFNSMLKSAAKGADGVRAREFCKLAFEGGANDFDGMLWSAAQYGHRDLCELAREWGATNFNPMLSGAAMGGHRDLCELAHEWGATDLNWMLRCAAEGGHRGLCELVREWGADDFNRMLRNAAEGGHRALCELAREWGLESGTPMDFDIMLRWAAKGGHRALCELAREWINEESAKC